MNQTTPFGTMLSIAQLVENPRLATIYSTLLREGPATVERICEILELATATAYKDVNTLEDLDAVEPVNDTRPYQYEAKQVELQLTSGNQIYKVTPALIEAVARGNSNEDIDYFVDRHGLEMLARVMDYLEEYRKGTVNARIMAKELDLGAFEAEIILQELHEVVESLEGEQSE